MVSEGYQKEENDLFVESHDFQVVSDREYAKIFAVFDRGVTGGVNGELGTSPKYYLFQVDTMLTDEDLQIIQCFLKKTDLRKGGVNILKRFYVWYEGAWYEKHVSVVKSYTDCYEAFAEFQVLAGTLRREGRLTWEEVKKAFPVKIEEPPVAVSSEPLDPKSDHSVRGWLKNLLGV